MLVNKGPAFGPLVQLKKLFAQRAAKHQPLFFHTVFYFPVDTLQAAIIEILHFMRKAGGLRPRTAAKSKKKALHEIAHIVTGLSTPFWLCRINFPSTVLNA